MEGFSVGGRWRRRGKGYQRLRRRKIRRGVGRRRRLWVWRSKVGLGLGLGLGPKIGIFHGAKKLMVWVRDAYVRMMMGLAKKGGMRGMSVGGFGNEAIIKEYDHKLILQIYKSFMPHPHHPPPTQSLYSLSQIQQSHFRPF